MDYKLISNIEWEDIDHRDAPDYSDAHIIYAEYDGVPMTDSQIELLNADSQFVYDALMDHLY